MASLPGVPAEIDNINKLWDLVHQKDEDLRHAAELGKMLLDEKEAEAEAHEAEKDALWRRIKDMATRVAELEQESEDARCLCQDQDACAAGVGNGLFGFASPKGISPRSSRSGVEEAKLRAKNDALERKIVMMREQLEEAKLELSAARKAHLYYERASLQSCGGSSRSPSPISSPNKLLEHGSAPSSSDGAPGGVVTLPIVGGSLMPPRAAGVSMKVSPHARPAARDNGHGVDSVSPEDKIDNSKSKEVLEECEDEIGVPQRKDMVNDLDVPRLVEENASLMVELDSKNELIEALRQQLKQLQYMTHQRSTRGRCTFSPRHIMEELGEAGSDDDSGDENEEPSSGVRERSFMDDLRGEAGGNHAFVMPPPSIDAPGTNDSENVNGEPWGAGCIRPVAPERRRSFGGVVPENIPLVLSSRKDGMHETGKIADWDSKRVHQGKIPCMAGREKSPFRGKNHSSSSLPRRCRRSLDRARGRGPSPVASSRHEAGGVTEIVGQSLTVAAASPLDPMMAGALETWPASPHGVPLSWPSAMRALAAVARVGGQQQQQLGGSEVEIAESDVAVGRQEAPISRGSVKRENVSTTKREVQEVQVPVIVGEKYLTSAFPSAGGDESITPESPKPKEANIREKEVEDVHSPPTISEQYAKLEATDKTVVDAQAVEGDEFSLAEKMTSPAAMKERMGLPIPAMGDGNLPDVDGLESTCLESVKPEAAIAKLEDAQVVPAVGDEIPFSAFKQESTSQASVMTVAVKGGEEMKDAKAPTVEDKGFFFSAQGRATASPVPVMEKVSNDQEPDVEGRNFYSAKVQGSASQEPVKPDHQARGTQRPMAKTQEKPVRPPGTEKAQPLPTAIARPRGMTRNRAEQKNRQAMRKLGLSAVPGVFCLTMKASNGDFLLVEKPDVFKHPHQSTYVIFGEADSEKSDSGGGSHHPTARRAGAEAFLRPAPAKCGPREVEVSKNPSDADRATVDDRYASAGIDPADVQTVMFHTGCVLDAAIEALREVGGDVVNAVMYLTEA